MLSAVLVVVAVVVLVVVVGACYTFTITFLHLLPNAAVTEM